MLCRRLTGRGKRPRRGSSTRRRFSCGQLVRLGRSGQEDHHIRWHTAADAVCAPTQAPVPNRIHALLRLLRAVAYLRLSIPMRTLRHRLHWSARIRGAVRRLRRTALGDTASVLVFIVLVFKQEASVRVHAVLPLHTVLPGPEPGWLRDLQPGRDKSWRPSPALPSTCSKRSRRIGHSSAPRRDAAIVHRRTGDLSLRLRRQRRRRPPRRRPPRCPVRAAASSRGERG